MKASTRYLPSRITSPISSSASCVMHSLTNKAISRGAEERHVTNVTYNLDSQDSAYLGMADRA